MRRGALVVLVVLFAGCGGGDESEEFTAPTEKTEIVEGTTAAAQALPRGEERARVGEAKWKAA